MVVGPGPVRVHCQFFGVSDTHTLDFAPIDTLAISTGSMPS